MKLTLQISERQLAGRLLKNEVSEGGHSPSYFIARIIGTANRSTELLNNGAGSQGLNKICRVGILSSAGLYNNNEGVCDNKIYRDISA
jgi:hypothetical protein